MKRWFAAWVLVLPAATQDPQQLLTAARELMDSAEYCFLITVDPAGQPQARLMHPFPPEPDLRIFLGTNPKSRKVAQIRSNPRATLACYDPKGPGYVTLLGSARLVETPSERRKRWRKGWEEFFPGGPEGSNYVLIELTPGRVELISPKHGIGTAPGSLRAPAIERKGGAWLVRP